VGHIALLVHKQISWWCYWSQNAKCFTISLEWRSAKLHTVDCQECWSSGVIETSIWPGFKSRHLFRTNPGGVSHSPPMVEFLFKIFYNCEVMSIKDGLIVLSSLFMLALFFSSVLCLSLYHVLLQQLYFAPGILIMFFLQTLKHSMDCASLRTRSRSRSCRVQYQA
jgi:hypothetical protein